MQKTVRVWFLFWAAAILLMAQPLIAAEGIQGRLVSAAWLGQNLARADLLMLDASPARLHQQQHIPGAVNADMFLFGPQDVPLAEIERRLRAWGLSPGQQIVIYDQGGTYMATRLFWDLLHHGLPAQNLFILDGGMAKWRAVGGVVTKEPTPAPPPGTVRITGVREDVRVRLPEFLAATGDARQNVMLEALDPSYFFGGAAFFNRGGHVPNATLMPSEDLYNPDKTFKSPDEIRRMLQHLGIRPEQQVLTYCGGGGAAAVPFFALKFILDYPKVKLYQESQLGWLQDERELPVWTCTTTRAGWRRRWGRPALSERTKRWWCPKGA